MKNFDGLKVIKKLSDDAIYDINLEFATILLKMLYDRDNKQCSRTTNFAEHFATNANFDDASPVRPPCTV